MSVSSIIDPTTGKIYDGLIGQGGGINLNKGQIITATAIEEVAFPTVAPANGSVLSYDATTDTGLRYIANNPTAITLNYQELFSATAGNNLTPVPASAHNNYVLTSDTDPANPTGLVWKAVGGSGVIQTNAPLDDAEVANVSTISINYTAVKGEIPAGSGVAKVGVLVPAPAQDKYVLTSAVGAPSGLNWAPPTGAGGIIDATAPLVDDAGVGTNTISINFSASVGEIPYGTGVAKTGALTVAPNPASSNQYLGTVAGIPTWKDVAGSGTITATAPLVESAGAGGASNIAINFTVAGQIPYGTGAGTGALLAPAPQADYVLTSTAGGGLSWEAQGGGSSATIFRNSSNNQPQLITKPATANDTLVITSDRVFNTGSTQIYNQATVGNPSNPLPVQGPPAPPLTIFSYTPASAETLTSYQSQIWWFSNALNSLFWKLSVFDSTNTTELISGGLTPVGNTNVGGEYFNFSGSGNLALVGGTTYNFALVRSGASGDQFQLAVVVVGFGFEYTGNITVSTTNYTGVATFTCPPGTKFRQYQSPTNLAGFQSATLEDYSAQSYVSSGDTNDWIAIGNGNGGVAYIA